MADVFVVAAARTPVGRAGKGSLVDVRPDDLAAVAARAALARSGVPASAVDDVQLGCGYPEGEQGYNLGRRVALLSGLPVAVPGSTVSRMCASSLQAVRTGFHAIRAGESQVHLAVGVESISRVGRTTRPEHMHPGQHGDPYPDVYVPMGVTAENVALDYGVSRQDMDDLALRSHRRAVDAQDRGILESAVVPVDRPDGSQVWVDDGPRRDTSAERLAGLPSAFSLDGPVTAGNSCPLSDGAAAVVLAGAEAVDRYDLRPTARVLASAVSGIAPELMGMGPVEATRKVLAQTGLTIRDVDVVELNEAFAAQVLAVCRELDVDVEAQLNPHGGAIALGHPFGMTGARLVGALLTDLTVGGGTIGLAALCVGGGQGMALLLERVG